MTLLSSIHLVDQQPSHWTKLAQKALNNECLSKNEGLAILQSNDDDLLSLLHAAFRIRKQYFGKKVKLNLLVNAKSGYCPEDCAYCSQSSVSKAAINSYPILDKEAIVSGAREAIKNKVSTYCIVASGRGPSKKTLDIVCDAAVEIKATMPLKICACLGILKNGDAERLKAAGVDRYNHNLNTSSRQYQSICSTHTYQDRINTVKQIKDSGISPCSGVIIGMGESDEDIIDIAYALRELGVDSIPVNFLNAIPGTPLEKQKQLTPQRCLKVLSLFRFICPTKEIRASGGREVNLRSLQGLALYPANAIFIGDYLTTDGQSSQADQQMISDFGFEVEDHP